MDRQAERVVLITGGSSGIGFEMAKQIAAEQSTVIICGRSQEKLDRAKREVPQLETIQCDITIAEDREALYDRIADQYPGMNMLMNNAAIVKRFLLEKTVDLEERITDEWRTNYLAPVLLTELFLPILVKNHGTVVNVTSGLAYVPLSIEPNYCATKAALHSMTQSMRIRFSELGIRVVEIFYPAVDTPFQNGHAPDNAISPDVAAAVALKGLNQGKDEIRVKSAGLLFALGRLMPGRSLKIVNGFVPDNVEELLTQEEPASTRNLFSRQGLPLACGREVWHDRQLIWTRAGWRRSTVCRQRGAVHRHCVGADAAGNRHSSARVGQPVASCAPAHPHRAPMAMDCRRDKASIWATTKADTNQLFLGLVSLCDDGHRPLLRDRHLRSGTAGAGHCC